MMMRIKMNKKTNFPDLERLPPHNHFKHFFNYLWNNIDIEGSDLSARLGHTYTLLSLNYSLE